MFDVDWPDHVTPQPHWLPGLLQSPLTGEDQLGVCGSEALAHSQHPFHRFAGGYGSADRPTLQQPCIGSTNRLTNRQGFGIILLDYSSTIV
jgi:hypothetical protein